MASEVDICNLALAKVGDTRISSLSETTKRAVLCNDLYALHRDDLLGKYPWNFATKRVALSRNTYTEVYEFANQFQLPADFLRMVDREYWEYDYVIEQDKILSNETAMKIEYVSKITDTNLYPGFFIHALAGKLAADLAYPLVQSNSLAERLLKEFNELYRDARLQDAQQGRPRQFRMSDYTNERL